MPACFDLMPWVVGATWLGKDLPACVVMARDQTNENRTCLRLVAAISRCLGHLPLGNQFGFCPNSACASWCFETVA